MDRLGPWAGERTMEAFQDMWPRWRQLTSTAAHRGVLCFGPNHGRNVTYTNPHRWLPGFRPDGEDAALRTLVTRYLYTYGPATPQHFARWLDIPLRHAVELFDDLAGELEQRRAGRRAGLGGGRRHGDAAAAAQRDPPAALLRRFRRRRSASGAAVPRSGRDQGSPRRARPATTRSCSSTAWSVGCGTSDAPVGSSPSPSNHCGS